MPTYRLRTQIPSVSAADLFAWHARPGSFQRLNPPWDPVRVLSRGSGLEAGTRVELEARVGPIPVRWTAVHTACDPPHGFTDEQEKGPFSRWRHTHRFEDGALDDEVDWAAPLGAVGAFVGGVGARLEAAFRFRHRRTTSDLGLLAPYRDRPPLRVLVSGASGLVGTALTAFLDAGGHEVVPLVRRAGQDGIPWSVERGELDPAQIEGFDAVVHLAGAPIAETRWDETGRARVRDSRVNGTALLSRALASLERPPKVLVSGSAVGFYGNGGDRVCTEDAPRGDNFLADVAGAWEAATAPAEHAGIRVVHLRTGIVLSALGGFLGALLPMFRLGAGGPVGSGAQFVPWIHLDDEVGLIHEAIQNPDYSGPINATAPEPVPQAELAKTLGRVLRRPALAPAPAFAVRLALGKDKAEELVLQGQRAVPNRAQQLGYTFVHPTLEPALRFSLGLPEASAH